MQQAKAALALLAPMPGVEEIHVFGSGKVLQVAGDHVSARMSLGARTDAAILRRPFALICRACG